MTQDEIIRMARESGVYLTKIGYEFDIDDLERFAALVAAHERETHRLPKMTEDQIWKCNNDGDGGAHICVAHQNVVDFARAIEREIGFARAELMLTRIKAAIAAEREACAKVCEELGNEYALELDRNNCAAAIRARGEK